MATPHNATVLPRVSLTVTSIRRVADIGLPTHRAVTPSSFATSETFRLALTIFRAGWALGIAPIQRHGGRRSAC